MLKFFVLTTLFGAAVWGQCNQTGGAVSPCINSLPTREFGQPQNQATLNSLNSIAPNLVEGRELDQPFSIAFDTSVTPPFLYIVDTVNNRVLGYKNPSNLNACGLGVPTCGFANLVVGPRPGDLTTTIAGGPNAIPPAVTAGFSAPLSAAVDTNGSLYVLDAGNNRILRFPSPLKQTGALWSTDLVIGQRSVASGTSANQGQPFPSATSLFFSSGVTYSASLTIESSTGALWVTDSGNNRVLRFPASQLAPNTVLPQADLVIGQSNFTTQQTATPPTGVPSSLVSTSLYQPAGIVFDQQDRLYVSDGVNGFYRVMYYPGGYGTGMSATRILGLDVQLANQTTPISYPNKYALLGPVGLAISPSGNLWVCDTAQHRIVEYDLPQNWPAAPTTPLNQAPAAQYSPPMIAVVGQTSLTATCRLNNCANQGLPKPSNMSLFGPAGIAFSGADMWVADTQNHRVLDFPQQTGGAYTTAAHLVGQLDYIYNSPNLIEGREVNFPSGSLIPGLGFAFGGGGIAVDHRSNPPHLYVADTANNRILCFKDVRGNPTQADIILGQTDPYSSLFNSPLNDGTTTTQSGLAFPTDVAVDANGNLWVADAGNGRALRFPAPFSQPTGSPILPTVVLGQNGFNGTSITDASIATMSTPFGLAIFSTGAIAISDASLNRIMIFKPPAGGDYQNFQPAAVVLGQSGFNTSTPGTSESALTSPRHIAVDTSDRLYVADAGNNRMLVFSNGANSTTGATASLELSTFSTPQGIKVSSITGEIWLANTNSRQLYRLPEYETLILTTTPTSFTPTAVIQTQTLPFSVELDNSDNVIIGEQANRVTFYYALLAYQHPANYNSQPLAPGQLALLYRQGLPFNGGSQINFTAAQAAAPLPTKLGDIQVFVNGEAAPIYELNPGVYSDIAFQVPSDAPTSGTANIVVSHPSTGEIIATGAVPMQQFNPGFFTSTATGTGLVAASNYVNGNYTGINGPSNPIPVGGGKNFIVFYLTGGGPYAGVPDGQVNPGVSTSIQPQIINASLPGGIAPAKDVSYSGSSFFPGVWQINFTLEPVYPPGCNNVIVALMGGTPSNVGPSGQTGSAQVYFCVANN